MEEYTYIDEWDDVVSRYILQSEPYHDYWHKSEEHALRIVDLLLRDKVRGRALDLGCGHGRLLERISRRFDEVVALDSNANRIDQSRITIRQLGLCNVKIQIGRFEQIAESLGSFDMILCSHVIQHLPTESLNDTFEQIKAILRPGGFLVILTSHSMALHDRFKTWRLSEHGNGTVEEVFVDEESFNSRLVDSAIADQVPSHAFSLTSLQRLLGGLKVRRLHCFHALHPTSWIDKVMFRDRGINLPLFKGQFGIDVLAIAQKPLTVKARCHCFSPGKHEMLISATGRCS